MNITVTTQGIHIIDTMLDTECVMTYNDVLYLLHLLKYEVETECYIGGWLVKVTRSMVCIERSDDEVVLGEREQLLNILTVLT